MPRVQVVSFGFYPPDIGRIEALAEARGCSKSRIVREAVRESFSRLIQPAEKETATTASTVKAGQE